MKSGKGRIRNPVKYEIEERPYGVSEYQPVAHEPRGGYQQRQYSYYRNVSYKCITIFSLHKGNIHQQRNYKQGIVFRQYSKTSDQGCQNYIIPYCEVHAQYHKKRQHALNIAEDAVVHEKRDECEEQQGIE